MNMLADLPKLGLVYQHTAVATTRKYIREHPDIVRRYVKSQIEAVHRIYTDKEASIRALAKFIGRNVDRDIRKRPGKIFSANPSCRKSSTLLSRASRQS